MAPRAPSWEATARPISVVTWDCGANLPKRIGMALLLSAFFGPVGLLYSSVAGAIYMLLGWCFLVLATCDDWITNDVIFPVMIVWPICIIWGTLSAHTHNENQR